MAADIPSAPGTYRYSPGISWLRIGIALVSLLITMAMEWFPPAGGPVQASDNWLRDHFVRWHATDTPETRLTLVDIDEASLGEIGPWPWKRERLADLGELLIGAYGARAVAMDLVMPSGGDTEGDRRLAAMAEHGPLVLAQAFDYVARPTPVREGRLTGGVIRDAPGPGAATVAATGYIANHAGLAAARCTGNIGFIPDADGAIRRIPLWTHAAGRAYPTLALALLSCGISEHPGTDARLPLAGDATSWRVPFLRREEAYLSIPAADVLALRAPRAVFAGRLVLIGSSSLGLADRVATPLSSSTSGVTVHAAALTALLDEQAGDGIAPWPGRWLATIFALGTALLAILAFPRLSATRCTLLLMCAMAAWLLSAYRIAPHDPLFVTSGPLLGQLFLLAVAIPTEWRIAQLASSRLLSTLSHYVAQPVLDELLKSGLRDPMAPTQLQVTTLIADMENYTALVEGLPLEESVILTRGFLDCLTRPVLTHQGTLDKYTGDGLVAFWGAPLPRTDHADQALDAALGIVEEVRRFNVRRLSQGRTPVRVRIGVESGSAVAGDLGTPFRSVYTAVGDSVNVAARLQELARDYPCDIIVGMGTAALTRRHRLRPLGVVTLRGRAQEETLFTPVTVDTGPPPVSGLPHEQQDVAESRRRAEVP
ncbi:CHASE2 domain-containing protein [Denitratisoma sp. DHT3]|uniref:CHASE2 domain-containing protein n=1 Tax=Denitratisoma sp. DHT3 TaxID=1981880 RepID=UPI001C9790E2|nr:adenylate/guanylate cyclase domain-containing protein [Denitratisoma sp. DHT3]